jgi:hypothetical protein
MAEGCSRIDTFVIGYCDNTRALLAHLEAEGPARLSRVRVLDPDPAVVTMLHDRGIDAATVDFRDGAALQAAGLESATTVIVFEQRLDGSLSSVTRVIRAVCPSAELLKVPAIPETRQRPWRIFLTWRFWMLVAITLVDALVFVVPLTALVLLTSAVLNPRWLRTAARFFDDLAEAR